MTGLDRKLISNLRQTKTQVAAIALVIASGVAVYVMSQSTLSSLAATQHAYYEQSRFADIFCRLRRAPTARARQIEAIPGVRQVQTRVVNSVVLDLPSFPEPIVGQIVGLSARAGAGLSRLHLRQGRLIEPGRAGEVVLHEAFAEAHGLRPGAALYAILNGRRQKLQVVGVALSPEYVYAIRPGELLPDNRRFGVLWMDESALSAAFDLEGAFNDVSVTLLRGANEPLVLKRIDELLARYGGAGAYPRADQASHKVLSSELTQLRSMALVFPLISLCVAGFLLNVVISRMIGAQREEIATLKAFGYTAREIGVHYVKFVLVVLGLGSALGIAAGAWLGRDLASIYVRYFRFPLLMFQLDPWTVAASVGLCVLAAALGAWRAVGRGVRLPPAAAMQPEPPASFRATLIDRLGIQRFVSPAWRMAFRYLERQPVRAMFTCLGIALAVAVLVLGSFLEDSVRYVMDFQFNLAQRHDVSIAFAEPVSITALHDVQRLPAVGDVQPFRSVAARLRFGPRSRRIAILGLPAERRLLRVVDVHERVLDLPENGLVLSAKAAQVLRAAVGDELIVELLEGERAVRTARITGLVHDFGEPTAYMNLDTLHRFLREGQQISGAFLAVDGRQAATLHRRLKQTPKVASVAIKAAALESFRKVFAEHLLRMRAFDVGFACIMVFGVVYNAARVSLSERSRDLATLRILGFTRGETFRVLLGELAVLTAAAIPLGLVLGYYLSALAIWALETETQRFPLVVDRSTYGFAAATVLIAALLSSLAVRRLVNRLDLVAVLKARE